MRRRSPSASISPSCRPRACRSPPSRQLIEELCADHDIPLLVLHDFDISGFTIAGTLQESTRRYQFTRAFTVIDLGLRLADTDGLERGGCVLRPARGSQCKGHTLRRYGASAEEIDFLLTQRRRVELNAMTSPHFVEFLERKLIENGIGKIVPDRETLELAGKRAAMIAEMQKAIHEVSETAAEITLPDDLEQQLRRRLEDVRSCPGTSRCSTCWVATSRATSRKMRKTTKTNND